MWLVFLVNERFEHDPGFRLVYTFVVSLMMLPAYLFHLEDQLRFFLGFFLKNQFYF